MSANSPSSDDLFRLFQEGDKDAFDLLFQKFHPGLVLVIALRRPNDVHTEKIAADSFFEAWKKRKKCENLASFSILLDKAAKKACDDCPNPPGIRRNPPKENRDPEFYPHDIDIDSPFVTLLEKVIEQMDLPMVTRRIFHLHFIEGKTRSQIAVKMNMTREAVAARIRRALDPEEMQHSMNQL
jgi:DNA-directed RNA polymerase specialized sigma24 family protein